MLQLGAFVHGLLRHHAGAFQDGQHLIRLCRSELRSNHQFWASYCCLRTLVLQSSLPLHIASYGMELIEKGPSFKQSRFCCQPHAKVKTY